MKENIAEKEVEIEIDFVGMIKALFRKIWVILLVAGIFGLAAFIVGKFFTVPEYVSTAKVYTINTDKQGGSFEASYNDLVMAEQLVNDYEEIITSNYVMDKVISDMKLDIPVSELEEMVQVQPVEKTRILEISVSNEDPILARDITNKVCEIAGDRIVEVMNIEAINILDEAKIPEEPSNGGAASSAIKGFLVGGVLSAAVVVICFLLNTAIKSQDDITRKVGLTNLAVIPYNKEYDTDAAMKDSTGVKGFLDDIREKIVALFAR